MQVSTSRSGTALRSIVRLTFEALRKVSCRFSSPMVSPRSRTRSTRAVTSHGTVRRAIAISSRATPFASAVESRRAMAPVPEDPAANDDEAPALDAEVYRALRDLARSQLRRERRDHTLQPTALVHEACLRLLRARPDLGAVPSAQLLAMAGNAMRRILVDHARRRGARKRGRGAARITLDDSLGAEARDPLDVLAVDDALGRLAELDPRQAKIVELRFFAGLQCDEVAEVLTLSRSTVQDDWAMARAWLRRELAESTP